MDRFPIGSRMLKENYYMDESLGGTDSLNTAVQTQKELITIQKKYGFQLRKWSLNTSRLLKDIPHSVREVNLDLRDNISKTIKILGKNIKVISKRYERTRKTIRSPWHPC